MSTFPKSARHPTIEGQIANWSVLSEHVDVKDESRLSDLPEFAAIERSVKSHIEIECSQQAVEIVGANAIRSIAKSYETLDSMCRCAVDGINLSAMTQGYIASLFAARGFCMLMGFSPLGRDSSVTLDAFPESSGAGAGIDQFTDFVMLHKYKRWGHQEVWKLTARLINTIKVPENLVAAHEWLRMAKVDDSTKFRNAYLYDDVHVSPFVDDDVNDFPDLATTRIFDQLAPVECSHQVFVTLNLMHLSTAVMVQSDLIKSLPQLVSKRRNAILEAVEEGSIY